MTGRQGQNKGSKGKPGWQPTPKRGKTPPHSTKTTYHGPHCSRNRHNQIRQHPIRPTEHPTRPTLHPIQKQQNI